MYIYIYHAIPYHIIPYHITSGIISDQSLKYDVTSWYISEVILIFKYMIVYIYISYIYISYNYVLLYDISHTSSSPSWISSSIASLAEHRKNRVAVQLGAGDLICREPGLAHGAAHALLLRRTVGRRHAGTPGAVVARVAKIQGKWRYDLHTRCICIYVRCI